MIDKYKSLSLSLSLFILMFPRNTFSKESLRKWEIGTYLIWQQKLKQSSLLKFPVRLLKKPVTGAFLVKAFCENFWWSFLCGASYEVTVSRNLMDFSFWWPTRLLNTEISPGGISWTLSFPQGCFIWYHCLSKSDWLFFLKAHQIVGHRNFFRKHFMEIW